MFVQPSIGMIPVLPEISISGRPGGPCGQGERRALVACDTHTAGEIEPTYKRWLSRKGKESDNGQEDE